MINILHVNMSLDPVTGGGTVERVKQLHEAMQGMSGVTSRVLSVAVADSTALPESEDVVLLPCWNRRWYLPAPKLLMMYRMVRQADVIHLMNHWTVLNVLIYWMARITGTPYVICPAGALPLFGRSQDIKRWYNRLVGLALIKHSDAAIVVAEDEVELITQSGVLAENVHHIPNGVRIDDFLYSDVDLFRKHAGVGEAEYLLFVGRLNEIKGPDILLDAFVQLKSSHPALHLVFIGPDGGLLEELRQKSADAEVADRVHFAGYAGGELKSSAYHGASILLVPSRQEAMSIVALEGAICSTPVILTDCCGFDALAEAGAAVLVKAEAASLVDAIRQLMADAKLRSDMGAAGHSFAMERYTWEIAACRHIELFRSCVRDSKC